MTADAQRLFHPDGFYSNVKWVVRIRDWNKVRPDRYVCDDGILVELRSYSNAATLAAKVAGRIGYLRVSDPLSTDDVQVIARVPYRRGETRP